MRRLATATVLLLFGLPLTAGATTIKLASLAPEGSVWGKALEEMGADWEAVTDGRVELRIYPGGVAGDDPDVVRKMRIGQLQAATLTVTGLADIDDAFEIFGVPLVFDSYDELYAVLDRMEAELAARLEAKGFVLLHWGYGGWAQLFSKRPIRTVADLKAQKLFVWAGDDDRVQLWKKVGFQPVPLAGTDILTGLQTGLIDVLPSPPIAALSFQWFRQTPYMLDLGAGPLVGGTVVVKSVWDKLAEADRAALRRSAKEFEARLEAAVPDQDREAIEQMTQRGLEVTEASDPAEWRAVAEEFTRQSRGDIVPAEMLDRLLEARDAVRSAAGGTSP
ncbi:MAG: TRAP transporter substrate-binding protein DctP [Thermoanaerobaculia bacterium]